MSGIWNADFPIGTPGRRPALLLRFLRLFAANGICGIGVPAIEMTYYPFFSFLSVRLF
jgi:hypothetical protein